jgi:cellobiose phosphorylase
VGLALAGEGAATRAWDVAVARVRSAGAPCFMMDAAGGWIVMLLTDALLGLKRTVDHLALAPLLPIGWDSLHFRYRNGRTDYHVTVLPATVGEWLVLDGAPQQDSIIELVDDGSEHKVELYVERRPADALAGHHDNGTRT